MGELFSKALIITDGKPGHENQSVALCRHLALKFEMAHISYPTKPAKALSYLLDRLGIYTEHLFQVQNTGTQASNISKKSTLKSQTFDCIISTGSTTFYPNKVIAKKLKIPNIAILNPKGYRSNFTGIFCPAYDHPPKKENIIELPLNLCAADKTFFTEKADTFLRKHTQKRPAIGFIIGGPNAISDISANTLKTQLTKAFALTDGYERWVTTSRRTPADIEALIASLPFDYRLINSNDPYNPVPAFIQLCDRLFVTSDSASMLSECCSFGTAKVEVLMNHQLKSPNKFEELIQGLTTHNALHIFNGSLGHADKKIDLKNACVSSFVSLTKGK